MQVNAYTALAAKDALTPWNYDLRELGPNEVDVQVTHLRDLPYRCGDGGQRVGDVAVSRGAGA